MILWFLILFPFILFFVLLFLFKMKKSLVRSFFYSLGITFFISIVIYAAIAYLVYNDVNALLKEIDEKKLMIILEDKEKGSVQGFLVSDLASNFSSEKDFPLTVYSGTLDEDYDNIKEDYFIVLVDSDIYEVLPKEIEFEDKKIEKEKVISLIETGNMDNINDLFDFDIGSNIDSESFSNMKQEIIKNKIDSSQLKAIGFLLLNKELVEQEGAAYLLKEYKEDKIKVIADNSFALEILKSSPDALFDLVANQIDLNWD